MKKKFTSGLSFKKLFIVFIVGCVLGVIWEESYLFIKRLILDMDDTSWRLHRGLIYGPFNPVYGIGAFIFTIFLGRKERPIWKTFLFATLLGGSIEYICSFVQETAFGTISWDYSDHFLNLHGRTNLLYAMFFGLIGTLFVQFVYPYISKQCDNTSRLAGNLVFYPLIIFFSFSVFISIVAVSRQAERREGLAPSNKLEEFCDEHYPDEVLARYFVNAEVVD